MSDTIHDVIPEDDWKSRRILELERELAAVTAERDEAAKQQKLGWERAAEHYRAYEQAMAERDQFRDVEIPMLQKWIQNVTAERDTLKERVATRTERLTAERDAERTARASLALALDAIMTTKDDIQRGVIVRLPFNLESLAKNALAFAAKLP